MTTTTQPAEALTTRNLDEEWVNIPGLVGYYSKGGKQLLRGRVLKQNRVNKYLCVARRCTVLVCGTPFTETALLLLFMVGQHYSLTTSNRITTDNRPSNLRYVSHTAFEASHAYQNKRKMLCQTK